MNTNDDVIQTENQSKLINNINKMKMKWRITAWAVWLHKTLKLKQSRQNDCSEIIMKMMRYNNNEWINYNIFFFQSFQKEKNPWSNFFFKSINFSQFFSQQFFHWFFVSNSLEKLYSTIKNKKWIISRIFFMIELFYVWNIAGFAYKYSSLVCKR